jgi:hypothetical protein
MQVEVDANQFEGNAMRFDGDAMRFEIDANQFEVDAMRFEVDANRFEVDAMRFEVDAMRFKLDKTQLLHVFKPKPSSETLKVSLLTHLMSGRTVLHNRTNVSGEHVATPPREAYGLRRAA